MTEQDETTFTAKQLARKLNTDPKTLRKFLRSKESPIEAVGQGGRYEFDAEAAKLIAAGFKDWGGVKPTKLKADVDTEAEEIDDMEEPAAPTPKKPRPKKNPSDKPRAKKEVIPVVVDDAIEELDIEEPSEEELEEIEDLDDLFDELND